MTALLRRAFTDSARYRWAVFSRVLAAFVGGYVLSSLLSLLLALLWPIPQAEAIGASTMLSFIFYALIIIWAFNTRRLRTVWLCILLSSVLCLALVWWLMPGGGV